VKPNQDLRTEVGVDPAQIALAQRIAKDLVDCDTSILSLIAVYPLGRVLHVSRSARLPDSEREPRARPETRHGGAVNRRGGEQRCSGHGETEAIVGIFKNQKVLLINLQEYNLLLALRLSRSANAEYVCDKIGNLLAARGEP
jgi:hypothetical protein